MGKQQDNDVNVKGFQEQTANQKRIEELLYEIRKLERGIQFYDKGFNTWDCLPKDSSVKCTGKKSSIKNKHWNHSGYNFNRWLEDARECTLVEIFSGELVQFDVKQGNVIPIDNCSYYKDFGHVTSMFPKEKLFTLVEIGKGKFIEEHIPKFDNEELVDSKDVFTCEEKCVTF